jgi:hypothetical protein
MKRIIFALLALGIGNCLASDTVVNVNVAAFQGGLSAKDIKTCYKKMKAFCQAEQKKSTWPNYVDCITPKMQQEKSCSQPLALIKTASNYLNPKFTTIKNYGPVAIAQGSVVMADKSSVMFLVTKNGDFIDVESTALDLKNAKNYEDFVKKYPHMEKFDLMLKPKVINLARIGQRFVFEREINDGCRACPTIGYAREAFDFNQNGKFQAATVIEIAEKK